MQQLNPDQFSAELVDDLARNGLDVAACYQCGRCSAGCPLAEFFDLLPMEIIRRSAYGDDRTLYGSQTIWLCASCETCTTRCPNEIDIAAVMDLLRRRALAAGVAPAEARPPAFHKEFLRSVKMFGRTYELGMLGLYKLRSGDLTGDMALGIEMMKRGKLHFLPRGIKGKKEIREIFKRAKKER